MKVKEAIETLQNKPIEEIDLANLYHEELMKRSTERWRSGKIPMRGFCTLLKEMNDWIIKVCTGLGMTEGMARYLMHIFNDQAYKSAKLALGVETEPPDEKATSGIEEIGGAG